MTSDRLLWADTVWGSGIKNKWGPIVFPDHETGTWKQSCRAKPWRDVGTGGKGQKKELWLPDIEAEVSREDRSLRVMKRDSPI